MEFREFKQAIQRSFNEMKDQPLFRSAIDKDEIWRLYLVSFPEGTNPKFRERTEHDCSCCRSFVKNAGGMVAIVDGQLRSIWDVQTEGEYQIVADALAAYVKSLPIENVFLSSESSIGTDHNREDLGESIRTWEHFHVALPANLQARKDDIGGKLGDYRTTHEMLLRALHEIKTDAIETVMDLIAQNSLYRGAEKKSVMDAFAGIKSEFDSGNMPNGSPELFAWLQIVERGIGPCRIRNDVIGTLLVDLSEGVDMNVAVKKYEDKVSGTNYQRPTALVTPRMRDMAKQTITDLGFLSSLDRRYATLEDVNVLNVLFADRSAKKRMGGDVFDSVVTAPTTPKNLDRLEEISIGKFISDVLPTAKSLEVLFENRQSGNLVSLIAPYDLTAKGMFKWDNPFSWTYNGDVADSIKERVKQAGGNVTGDVCCRLAWFNYDDLDFHMAEPGFEIYYVQKSSRNTGGQLDVDMNAGYGETRSAVENIFYPRLDRMIHGTYSLCVHQFHKRESDNVGFDVEIDILGTVHSFHYAKGLSGNQTVEVAKLIVNGQGVKVDPVLPSSQAVRENWAIKTETFHPVTALMRSPNFWGDHTTGNEHFFFMLDGCKNDGSARGFYNEFLSSELEPHRKTMEMVGAKMRTEECPNQLSGLGFSSTQRNHVIVRVTGSFTRLVKVTF